MDRGLVFQENLKSAKKEKKGLQIRGENTDNPEWMRENNFQTHFLWDIESPSVVTSNLCAGSIGCLVFGSIGRLTLEYSVS